MPQLIGQGGVITLDAFFLDGAGDAVDPTTPFVSIIDAIGTTVVANAVPTHIAVGHYQYAYAVDVAAELGAWDAEWTGIINGSPVEAHDGFTVVAAGTLVFTETLTSRAFVTVAEYAAATQATIVADSALEAAVQFALEAACDEIRKQLGDQILDLVEDDVIVLHGTGHQSLILPQLPVVAVNSVTIDKGLSTERAVTDYAVDFSGVLYRRAGWPWGYGNITVDYDHGYDAYEGPEFPTDLKNVAIQVAKSVVNALPAGITSETIGGYSYTRSLESAIGADAYEKLLNRYAVKRVPVP